MRKPIQIAIDSADNTATIYALCDDGTIWSHWVAGRCEREQAWELIRPIPQDEEVPDGR